VAVLAGTSISCIMDLVTAGYFSLICVLCICSPLLCT
jgi:hypothetical protein